VSALTVEPVHMLAGLGGLVTVLWVWRVSVRRSRQAADAAQRGARLMSLGGRVLITAALLVGAQWVVVSYPTAVWVRLVALGLPALFAAHTLTRALTVTTFDPQAYERRRGRR